MLAEIGNLFIALAFGCTSVQLGAALYNRSPRWTALAEVSAFLQGSFLLLAFFTLMLAFFLCDFTISLVFLHDHTSLPWYYRLAASWGNHAGSFLFFLSLLSCVNIALASWAPLALRPVSLVSQGGLILLLLLFLIITSHPFHELPFSPLEGQSLNPLLQDKGLLIHPPFLYLGYVGFSAPFSLALALLWTGKTKLISHLRAWILWPWGCLTAGIALGSWWAYYELGWGGWWFWDPVETLSLMPWLAGTALLHTLLTPHLLRWSLLLALLTFGLCLLGTFLIRSGLITSLHSFAEDPQKGYILLSFITLILGMAFALWAWKNPRGQAISSPFFSKDSVLLGASCLFICALFTLLFGLLVPVVFSVLGKGSLCVEPPYFERTTLPLLLFLLALLPIGVLLKKGDRSLLRPLALPFTLVLSIAVLFLYGTAPFSLLTLMGTLIAIWVLSGTSIALWKKQLSVGTFLIHFGAGISLLGLSVGGGWRQNVTHSLGLKETLTVGGIPLTLRSVDQGKTETYLYEKAQITFPGKGLLTPEKRLYRPQNMLISETAIASNGLRDLYVVLGAYQGNQRWLIQASYIPLAPWVWLGALLMVLGCSVLLLKKGAQLTKASRDALLQDDQTPSTS